MKNDIYYLEQTLSLAKKGMGLTSPNPMVGCVIVNNGNIIGKGYHHKSGLPHAEVEAIGGADGDLNGATLYVNLEPCSHHGKTPPCTELIVKSGIKKVVCSVLDPNPKVNGQGIQELRAAGLEVVTGLLQGESRKQNEHFFTFHEKRRPFIALKFASSLDGKIATRTGESKWITNEKARIYARNLRSQYQAIIVGVNTVIADDPNLGVGLKGKRDPLRIILDSKLRIPLNAQVLRDKNVLIVTTINADIKKETKLTEMGVEIIKLKSSNIEIKNLLEELSKREIISIFVEGGSSVLGSFIDAKLVDKVYAFHAPILIGGVNSLNAVGGNGVKKISDAIKLKNIEYKRLGDNMLTIGYPS